ncbi:MULTISPECIES: poly-beta-1,6 N-acetyl-D-glucosamine export porin PgaA [Pseudomonas]|uniref:poly-beta-1,6 N-acetyl-D-glucosamine export porin PgaA n=1 Tax=Pseudomonas TaxID=286 RepID=UPI00159FC6CE|nr:MULTISPECIES: poly-beta-1,6 N-acetyl-D-glucosamine export porin PgaA [Pseudomonas]NWE49596.1 poly-beta-1,6 N-acetyl-D-glucosamine export porin PgaA [Pseudomonas gingeri]NWE72648.1 poly-beta-1,6 N-acetyl-D-glucosamine export porin PgaA [Pseudomonas gingeri]BBP74057.1 poly-beta-1,6 N-acetyl-D-glucosamine export porin PgaA [Pseudomonas sp. Ost2]
MPRTAIAFARVDLRLLIQMALCGQLFWSGLACADASYDQLIRQARNGDYAPALSQLRQLPAGQQTTGQVSDHLQIAGWAGLDSEVVTVYESSGAHRTLPVPALTATARAYRNLKRWDDAERVYRLALTREPQSLDAQLGLAVTQADGGDPQEAVRRARELVARQPDDPSRRLALGYALTRAGDRYGALFEYDQAFLRASDNPEVAREYLFALERARLPEPALRLARNHPQLIGPLPVARLEGELAAERVRLAEFASRSERERFVVADRALADYEQLLANWASNPDARDDVVRWRIDRMGALKARARSAEVLVEYQKLIDEGVTIPTYALRWVAASYLDVRQPETATQLYRQVLSAPDADPADRVDDTTALFYALLESDKPQEAREVAQTLAKNESPRVELKGLPIGNPSDSWMDAQQLNAQVGLYDNAVPDSEQGLEALFEQVPGNIGLRVAMAQMYLARDWPRRAEYLNKETEALAPRDRGLEVAQGYTALDLQEWRQLDALTDDLVERFPENRQVQRLQRLRDVHDMAELRVEAYTGKSFGGGSDSEPGAVTGSRDYGLETVLYSPPINEDWRLFAGAGYAFGKFTEGDAQRRWQRLGVERRTRDMTLEAEVSNQSYGEGNKIGARLAAALDIDDHWQYGGSLERLSAATPLRALKNGISANSASAFLRWRANESREWKLAVTPSRFSDGNRRIETVLTGREGLYSAPHVQVDLGLEVSTSHNTKSDDVPYFNPKSDFSVLPTVNVNHILYHRYETVWSQQFQVGAGSYSQRDHSTGAMALLGYGQRVSWNDVLDAGALVSWLSRPYDGDRERDLRLTVDLTYRF